MSMLKRLSAILAIPIAALMLTSCGGVLGNADGAAKLTVKAVWIKDLVTTSNTTFLRFFPHEAVFDTGRNFIYGDGDEGDDDNFPEAYEVLVSGYPVMSDVVLLDLLNEPRLGVKEPVDLIVYRVDFTFRDKLGNSRPLVMPHRSTSVNAQLTPNEVLTVQVEAVPIEYKTNPGGLRDIFLYGQSADNLYGGDFLDEVNSASDWKVYIDVYARDPENGDTVHAQAVVDFVYQNPIPFLGKKDVTTD